MIKNIYEKFRANMIMVKERKLSSKGRNTNNTCFHHSYSILHWKFKSEQDTETKRQPNFKRRSKAIPIHTGYDLTYIENPKGSTKVEIINRFSRVSGYKMNGIYLH